jgi:hypothetical protein
MDDLTSRLQSVLRDPEAMRDLSELAAMLREPEGAEASGGDMPDPGADLPLPDMGKLLGISRMLGAQPPDANAVLLRALKPHLSPERAKRAEKALRLLRLWQIVSVLRESGMLSSLTD